MFFLHNDSPRPLWFMANGPTRSIGDLFCVPPHARRAMHTRRAHQVVVLGAHGKRARLSLERVAAISLSEGHNLSWDGARLSVRHGEHKGARHGSRSRRGNAPRKHGGRRSLHGTPAHGPHGRSRTHGKTHP